MNNLQIFKNNTFGKVRAETQKKIKELSEWKIQKNKKY